MTQSMARNLTDSDSTVIGGVQASALNGPSQDEQ
jgi:hypothetical protein